MELGGTLYETIWRWTYMSRRDESTPYLLNGIRRQCLRCLTNRPKSQPKSIGSRSCLELTDDRNCTATNQPQAPGQNQWGAPGAGWNNNPGGNWPQPGLTPPLVPARPKSPATFDGKDRITIKEGWFLIRGDGSFFVEHAGTGL